MTETDSFPSTESTPMSDGREPSQANLDSSATSFSVGADATSSDSTVSSKLVDAKQAIGGSVSSLQQQATDKLRLFAEDGKAKAGGALDQFAQMLLDAAGQVDEKLGGQYGDHARTAATTVQKFADSVRDKDVDDLADDVRGYIRKSPAAAVGVTAALGFALARMVHAGLDQRA